MLTHSLDFVLPPTCPACDTMVSGHSVAALCGDCWGDLQAHVGPQCRQCGTQVDALFRNPDLRCGACAGDPPAFTSLRAAFVYAGTARGLVLAVKYQGRHAAATYLARNMGPLLPPANPQQLLIPVPLHTRRLRERGYNQSLWLAKYLAKAYRRELSATGVIRRRDTPSQANRNTRQRLRNVSGAFTVNPKLDVRGRDIILIDDVVTSTATCQVISKVLIRAGAASVQVLAAARALPK